MKALMFLTGISLYWSLCAAILYVGTYYFMPNRDEFTEAQHIGFSYVASSPAVALSLIIYTVLRLL